MTLSLKPEAQGILDRLVASGQFGGPTRVVEAGLQKLEAEANDVRALVESFPPGSLAKYFNAERDAEEVALLKCSSVVLEKQK